MLTHNNKRLAIQKPKAKRANKKPNTIKLKKITFRIEGICSGDITIFFSMLFWKNFIRDLIKNTAEIENRV